MLKESTKHILKLECQCQTTPQVIHLFPYKNTIFSYLLYNFFPIDENDFIFY